ncbi:MAG: outer membrane protein transport protein [Duncaniella sp.]|nr:outer membrane protein transport protein [Duncaniella sp.]
MKKFMLAATAAATVAFGAMAEGYQVNSLSAKQIGMGHTGIALKLGSESMFFNPAGMGFMDATLDLSGSVTGIMPSATATVDGKEYETNNDISTPMGVHAAFSIYDNLKAGVSFYTPYGSSINWTDNWPGAVLNQSCDLKVFTIQPTVAWKILPNLSIGAGAMISWGSVNLNKGLISAATADKALPLFQMMYPALAGAQPFGSTTPASVNLNGNAEVAVGVNIGAMWDINEKWTVGASYRSQMNMKVKAGEAKVTPVNAVAQAILGDALDLINQSNFKAQMPCPWVLGLGVSYKPVKPLTLAFDARLTGWNAYKQLDVEFLSEQASQYDQHIKKDYKNSWCFSLGAQYAVTNRLDARLGMMLDTTPVNDNFYNPETPGMTKIEPTAGLSFRPIPALSIDIAFMYVAGLGKNGASCEYVDMIGGKMLQTAAGIDALGPNASPEQQMVSATIKNMGFQPTGKFTADYRLHALIPSIGISYRF